MRRFLPHLLTFLTLATAAALAFRPNAFGNQPNAVFDESLFVTSALASLAAPTLPGWDLTPGGAYYGGPLAYLATALIAFTAAGAAAALGSVRLAETWTLLHTGDLMHVVRLANGLCLFAGAVLLVRTARALRKEGGSLHLLAGLLFASSLFSTFMPTGRVWTLQVLLELSAAVAVFRFEALRRTGETPVASRHAALLIWFAFAAFLQNIAGAATGLWILYALWLRHFDVRTAFAALRRQAPWLLLAAALHVSFFRRFLDVMFEDGGLSSAARMEHVLADGSIDWATQLAWPVRLLADMHPIALPLLAAALASCLLLGRRMDAAARRWALVAAAHPALVYAFHYVAPFRFGVMVHYALPLAAAVSVAVAFLPKPPRLRAAFLAVAWTAAVLVSGKAAALWWTPSTERQVVAAFSGERNREDVLIVVEDWRLMFPLNAASLEALEGPVAATKRVELLKARPEDVATLVGFRPTVRYGPAAGASYEALASRARETWIVSMGCEDRCVPGEASCEAYDGGACAGRVTFVPDGENVRNLFATGRLGYPYFARRVR